MFSCYAHVPYIIDQTYFFFSFIICTIFHHNTTKTIGKSKEVKNENKQPKNIEAKKKIFKKLKINTLE